VRHSTGSTTLTGGRLRYQCYDDLWCFSIRRVGSCERQHLFYFQSQLSERPLLIIWILQYRCNRPSWRPFWLHLRVPGFERVDWLADRNQHQWLEECGTSTDYHLDRLRCQLDDGAIDLPHNTGSFQQSNRWDKAIGNRIHYGVSTSPSYTHTKPMQFRIWRHTIHQRTRPQPQAFCVSSMAPAVYMSYDSNDFTLRYHRGVVSTKLLLSFPRHISMGSRTR